MRLKKGDEIIVIAGKDKGRKGKIEKVFPKERKVLVLGINIVKKHVKPKKEGEKGGIVEVAKPIDVCKVALLCPKCGKPTKVGYLIAPPKGGADKKERICRKCNKVI
jgi:large subunit ribosomal protein L24